MFGGGSLLANISGETGQFPATPVAAERLKISLFHVMLRYWQTIILFCRNRHIWQTERIARAILCVNCITCSRTVKMELSKKFMNMFV